MESDDECIQVCGKIVLTLKSRFIFNCLICTETYKDSETFIEHFKENHLIKSEDLKWQDESISKTSSGVKEEIITDEEVEVSLFYDEDCLPVKHISSESNSISNNDSQEFTKQSPLSTLSTSPIDCALYAQQSSEDEVDACKLSAGGRKKKRRRLQRNSDKTHPETDDSPELTELMKKVTYTPNGVPMCPLCDDQIKRRNGIRQHMRRHLNPNDFVCSICTKGYSSQQKLEYHMRSKHEEEAPTKTKLIENQCHLCKKILANHSNLKHHLIRHDERNKRYQCLQCSKKFYSNKEMKLHTIRMHTNLRTYLCTQCGLTFKSNDNLKRHMLTHLSKDQFEYKCPICQKAYKSSSKLTIHLTSHKTERDVECTQCNKKFKAKHGLTQHMKLHENLRKYCCEICQERFNLLSGLRTHIKNKH